MERRFAADEWNAMTVAERVRRCAVLADEAKKLAESATAPLRTHYLKLAEEWLDLAQEMTRAVDPNSN